MKKGWNNVTLGSVCQNTSNIKWADQNGSSFKYIDLSSVSRNDLTITQTETVNSENAPSRAKKIVLKDDVIFATTRPTLKRVTIINEEYNNQICSTGYAVLRPIKNKVDSRFIYYFILSEEFMNRMENIQRGASYPAVSDKDVKSTTFWIPKSLTEQKQIVTLLDAAFAKIDQAKANIEKNIANAKELLESFSQSIFKKNIEGNDSETLNEICELIVDCEHKTAPTQNTGYPSIRTPNIGYGELILDKVNRVSEEVYLKWSRRAIPQPGDLILAREAPAGNIGVIPKDTYVCLGQRTVLIRPKEEKFISKYLAFLILSKDVQKRLLSHSQGATVGHINMRDIRAFKIYNLPSLKEQNRVVEKIEAVLKETRLSEQQYYKKLQNLVDLKKSLLQKAFAGELTQTAVPS